MRFKELEINELEVALDNGETLYFDINYLRSPNVDSHITPHFRGAVFSRLLTGKLWEAHLTAPAAGAKVVLGGPEASGRFAVVVVNAGSNLFVRLHAVHGYAFGMGGRFRSSMRLLDPVRWIIGAATSVIVQGPASLVFYGRSVEHVTAEAGDHCFADQLYAFGAESRFRVSGYRPNEGGVLSQWFNAASSTINLTFLDPVEIVKTTIRDERPNRLKGIARLVFVSLLIGWCVERVVMRGLQEMEPAKDAVVTAEVETPAHVDEPPR
jgi:hypothetical protein